MTQAGSWAKSVKNCLEFNTFVSGPVPDNGMRERERSCRLHEERAALWKRTNETGGKGGGRGLTRLETLENALFE